MICCPDQDEVNRRRSGYSPVRRRRVIPRNEKNRGKYRCAEIDNGSGAAFTGLGRSRFFYSPQIRHPSDDARLRHDIDPVPFSISRVFSQPQRLAGASNLSDLGHVVGCGGCQCPFAERRPLRLALDKIAGTSAGWVKVATRPRRRCGRSPARRK